MNAAHRLLHVSAWVRTIGGVETLLARHAAADTAGGFDAWQLSLFDKIPARPGERYSTQSFSWRSTPRAMRRALACEFARRPGSITVWHNGWGLPWFADLDGSTRRILCLQDNQHLFGDLLPRVADLVDGVTCLSASSAHDAARLLPNLSPARFAVMPLPIAPPAGLTGARPPRPELVIGCAGRLVRPQKRWDRLIPFVQELRRLKVNFRLEIASDGPLRKWLERRLASDPAIRFLGVLKTPAYWRHLQDWDAAMFFSDHEGGPIVLLDAMAAGVLPFFPAIGGSLGDEYAGRVDPRCYYPAGDPHAAARALQAVFASPAADVSAMRRRAQELARPHATGTYDSAFAGFAKQIAAWPRISRAARGDRPARLEDWLPLALLTRWRPDALNR